VNTRDECVKQGEYVTIGHRGFERDLRLVLEVDLRLVLEADLPLVLREGDSRLVSRDNGYWC
jgi:hypothetical protein